jgi:hypothetical protein
MQVAETAKGYLPNHFIEHIARFDAWTGGD